MMNENVQPDVARGEFRKKFSLNVSIKWHSVEKVNLEDPPCPQKAPSILLPSSLKPPSALPPRLAPFPSVPPGFCRAVGGPTAPKLPYPRHSSPSSSQGKMMLAGCPVLLLQKMCEANGFGQPVYEMFYSHAGSDGFLYFSYKLHIHGAPTTFEGLVMILPGPSASTMLKEAERAAAQQVLQRVCNNQLAA